MYRNRIIDTGIISIAGTIIKGKVKITNTNWPEIDTTKNDNQSQFTNKLQFINDFVAQCYYVE